MLPQKKESKWTTMVNYNICFHPSTHLSRNTTGSVCVPCRLLTLFLVRALQSYSFTLFCRVYLITSNIQTFKILQLKILQWKTMLFSITLFSSPAYSCFGTQNMKSVRNCRHTKGYKCFICICTEWYSCLY